MSKKIYMVRCPKCNKENWAMAVASGQCAWCGHKAKDKDVDGSKVWYGDDKEDDQ